jgi:ribosomal protein S18 acetylase RimI-like enzyme
MDLSPSVGGDEQALLDLEFLASEPYTAFVFSSTEQALRIRRYLYERDLCEFSPPYGRLLRDQGRVVGLLAILDGAELTRCRLKATIALAKSGLLAEDPALGARLQLAGQTLLKLRPDDFYISRVAAADSERRRGLGSHLVRRAEHEARARGCPRVALEVSPVSTAAIRLYSREGYQEIDAREAHDPLTGRSLRYLHLAKTLS